MLCIGFNNSILFPFASNKITNREKIKDWMLALNCLQHTLKQNQVASILPPDNLRGEGQPPPCQHGGGMLTRAAVRHQLPVKGRAGVDNQNIHLITLNNINLRLELDRYCPILHRVDEHVKITDAKSPEKNEFFSH